MCVKKKKKKKKQDCQNLLLLRLKAPLRRIFSLQINLDQAHSSPVTNHYLISHNHSLHCLHCCENNDNNGSWQICVTTIWVIRDNKNIKVVQSLCRYKLYREASYENDVRSPKMLEERLHVHRETFIQWIHFLTQWTVIVVRHTRHELACEGSLQGAVMHISSGMPQ